MNANPTNEHGARGEVKHEIIKWPTVLFPAIKPKRAAAIDRLVVEPRESFCSCGKNCALNKEYVARLRER